MSERVFGNNYEVLESLGEGSFGVVYLCHDRKLNRRVALKMLRPELADPRELRRFLGEARRLASLNHENVVRVYDLDDSVPYMVMEYFPGRTLREVPKNPPMPLPRSLRILVQVARGLKALHELNIVHGDLSPNNIMIDETDRAKILDLGLARDIERMSSGVAQGHVAGTLKYMAPEVIDGQRPSFASDIFSYSVILYELVTGLHPFEAEHFMSMAYNIIERPHPPVAKILPQAPAALGELVDECLAKDFRERPVDLADIVERLQSLSRRPDLSDSTATLSAGTTPRRRPVRLQNPYFNRVMIKKVSDFYGRKHEVNRIYSRLNAPTPGSVSVVGDRKIGKSSLLNFVYMRRNRERNLEHHEATIMVYLDLQQQKGMSLEVFVDALLCIANLELRGRIDTSDCARNLSGIEELLRRFQSSGLRLVLILDEFEAITANPNFDLEFFSFLRYLANHYNVAYLTSSARDLQQLCHTKEIRDSPFFNIFTPLPLSVFRPEEARELIAGPSAEVGRPLEPYTESLLAMAGLFPFFLQIACSHTLEYAEEHPGEEPDFDEIRRRFYEEVRLHYRFIWSTFGSHERSAILRLAEGRPIPASLRHVCEELERRHYLESEAGHPKLFSTSFRAFVETEVSARRHRPWFLRVFQPGRGA